MDRVGRLLHEIPEKHDPLPSNIVGLLNHAYDDVQEARGKPREYVRVPSILSHFDVGDEILLIVQSYSGEHGQVTPMGMSTPDVRPGKIISRPRGRPTDADFEKNIGGKPWFFTSEMPVAVAALIDASMHLELESDRREVIHLRDEHWSTWHEKNGTYWSVLTIFRGAA